MTYSKSDQPKTETIKTFEDPTTRNYNIFHDKRGNLVDDGRQVFEYDALNRLTGVWQSARGGQPSGPGSEFEPGTKAHPIAAFTYDGYGHRLTARYNINNDTTIDDDPVDVYAYDRLWRVRTVTRATPSGSSAEATWTYYVREKWYYHDSESGQEMMTGPNSTDAPIMRLIDRNGDGDFNDPGEEQHFVNDHQGSTVLVTGKATLDPTNGNLISRAPIIAHVKYDQYGVPKFVHPADVNSDGAVDALDTQHWLNAWREYRTHNTTSNPPSEIWKGTVDSNESGVVDESTDGADPTQPSATNTDWVAFQAKYAAATAPGAVPLDQQLGNLPLYAGYWWDEAIGLYHVRHRVYRPEWGRWLQRDPLGYAPGWNLYQYVNGMPWSAVDPMGLEPFPFEWHHDLPQAIFGPDGFFAEHGIDIPSINKEFIDQPEYGSIMRWEDHRGPGNMKTHLEYNNAWKSWAEEQLAKEVPITRDSVIAQLKKFRETSPFTDWLGKGKRAAISYKEWGGKDTADKMKWLIKEGKILTTEEVTVFKQVLQAAKKSGTAIRFVHAISTGANAVGKVAKVLTPIIIVANIASGEEVMRATVDGLLPVNIDTVDELRRDGLTIIDESLTQKRYRMHRGTDSLLHELTGIPQNERAPLSSPPRCDPR